MQVSKLIASKTFQRLPLSIRSHSIFQQIKRITKPFPNIGLVNSLERCERDFDGKPAYIGFSASGITGFWDIATMSMRGVSSCMHWDNRHFIHLVGSVTDPFLGMVYITDNQMTPYGISFRRRALVRVVYAPKIREYRLLIERIYKDTGNTDPSVYKNQDPQASSVSGLFKRFLQSKLTDKSYKVILPHERSVAPPPPPYSLLFRGYMDYIPKSSSSNNLPHSFRSMSDCGLVYDTIDDDFAKKYSIQD